MTGAIELARGHRLRRIGMIKTIEAEHDAIASAKIEAEHTSAKKIQDLAKIKCIGPNLPADLSAKCSTALLTIVNNWRAMSV